MTVTSTAAPRTRSTAALIRMRLSAFVRSGRALAPAIAGLVVLGVIYGGGSSPAAVGLRLLRDRPCSRCWPGMTKLLLDAEPDVQRRLARLAVGAGREAAAGLLAAVLLGLAVCGWRCCAPSRSTASGARCRESRRWVAGIARSASWPTCWPCRPGWRWARCPAGR